MSTDERITQALIEMRRGDERAAERLMLLVYDKLRALAGQYMASERAEHTLQPTALLNEACLRLFDQSQVNWQDKAHFVAAAAQIMRRILVDHARQRAAAKRGGGWDKQPFDEQIAATDPQQMGNVIAIDEALEELKRLNPRQAKVVELRFFGGLNIKETAYVLGVSDRTVNGDWDSARLWLQQRLNQ